MIHALIMADIEGIVDIYDLIDIEKCSELYTQEIQVYIEALIENGIERITICDAHNEGNLINRETIENYNIDRDQINIVSRVENISFKEKYDFAIMVGYHGMGKSPGILPHTMRFDFKVISASDRRGGVSFPIGEVEIDARWLSSHGIPVILVTGDREATYEANCFNPYREVCCVKSRFQLELVDKSTMYKKLMNSVKSALDLNKELCFSQDNSEIAVEFYNSDVAKALNVIGYKKNENRILFSSCADFVNDLYTVIDHLNKINEKIWKENMVFLKEVRKLTECISKEDLAESEIGSLLNNNLLFLDQVSKDKIMLWLKAIASKSCS